jgi:hypothetical protein
LQPEGDPTMFWIVLIGGIGVILVICWRLMK